MPLLAHLCALLTAACVAGLWQGAALALMAAALLRLMPRASAGMRYTLLVAMFAAAVLLPWVRWRGVALHDGLSPVSIAPWVGGVVACLWLAAAAVRAVQLFLAWRHLCAVRRNATPIALEGMGSFAAGDRSAVLCTSADVDSPVILGFRSPRLLLPTWMVPMLSADELRQIAVHECEHLRRGDDWLNLLLQVGLMLSPLNPALVWLNRRIGVQRELACDAAVVERTAQPLAYASCLTRLAEQRMQQNQLRLALAAWGSRSELSVRVHALLQQTAGWTPRQSGVAAAATAAVLLAASVGIARTPELVRIADAPMAMAAAQPTATVVPAMNLADLARTRRMDAAPSAHMVATSFELKPQHAKKTAKVKSRSTRKAVSTQKAMQIWYDAIDAQQQRPRLLRTSASVATSQDDMRTDAEMQDEAPVRFVTTEFVSPYVAVPTPAGWLLIEL